MTTDTLPLDSAAIHESFQEWLEQEDSLDAQWSESLSALAAYQSHLDAWQQELARERDELRTAREELERDRATAEQSPEQHSENTPSEPAEERNKIAQLSQQLLARTEELRGVDQLRAELMTELELARAHAKELVAAVEEQKRTLEHERSAWTDQLHHMRKLLERRAEGAPAGVLEEAPVRATKDAPKPPSRPAAASGGEKRAASSPVLSSIVEQFGKLRQQRAFDRQAGKKTR